MQHSGSSIQRSAELCPPSPCGLSGSSRVQWTCHPNRNPPFLIYLTDFLVSRFCLVFGSSAFVWASYLTGHAYSCFLSVQISCCFPGLTPSPPSQLSMLSPTHRQDNTTLCLRTPFTAVIHLFDAYSFLLGNISTVFSWTLLLTFNFVFITK